MPSCCCLMPGQRSFRVLEQSMTLLKPGQARTSVRLFASFERFRKQRFWQYGNRRLWAAPAARRRTVKSHAQTTALFQFSKTAVPFPAEKSHTGAINEAHTSAKVLGSCNCRDGWSLETKRMSLSRSWMSTCATGFWVPHRWVQFTSSRRRKVSRGGSLKFCEISNSETEK